MTDHLPVATVDDPLRLMELAEVRGVDVPQVHPVGRFRRHAYEHMKPATARCYKSSHEAPGLECTCGFHAVASVKALTEVTDVFADSVVLDVEVAGIVIEYERGLRAGQQSILGIGFPRSCAWCGGQASAVAPGRLWRSICADSRDSGHITALSRADATAALGVDVGFVDVPTEPRGRSLLGAARSLGMCMLMFVCIVAGRDGGVSLAAMIGVTACAGISLSLLVLTVLIRSARQHTTWFVRQCACVCSAWVQLTLGAP